MNDEFIRNTIALVQKGARSVVDTICQRGDKYVADEVAYEHGHPSSDLKFLTDYYMANPDDSIMPSIKNELKRTLTFDGNQPHYTVNGVPIRHWDAFWFGKYELWGDTFPHWVSCQSACGYANYYIITQNAEYRDRAIKIFRANLALINKDGSAYNSYIFNEKSNGRPAARYDTLSNDQDWIFYYYLKYCEKGVF